MASEETSVLIPALFPKHAAPVKATILSGPHHKIVHESPWHRVGILSPMRCDSCIFFHPRQICLTFCNVRKTLRKACAEALLSPLPRWETVQQSHPGGDCTERIDRLPVAGAALRRDDACRQLTTHKQPFHRRSPPPGYAIHHTQRGRTPSPKGIRPHSRPRENR
jgi:hypothetical protein